MRVRNQSLSVIAGLLFLSACTSEVSKQSIGKIRLAMQWPQASAFSIQTIPENTSHITIRIRGVGLNQPLERSLERQTGATQRLEFVLPTGSKEVRVQALSNDEQVLAEAIDSVEIRSNQTSKIELDMKSLPVPKPIPSSSTANRPSSGGASGGSSGNNTRPPVGDGNLPSAGGPKPLKPDASSPPSLPPLISPPPLPPRPTRGGGGAENQPARNRGELATDQLVLMRKHDCNDWFGGVSETTNRLEINTLESSRRTDD